MESAKLNDWMQVVGVFAVVASLVFVGMEMRQSQKIALSAAYQAGQTQVSTFEWRHSNPRRSSQQWPKQLSRK